jgi:uncharacterized protein (TIGR03118 family)
VPGTITDPHLVNPWGLAASPTGPLWVANNGTGLATMYNGNTGQPQPLVVTIPPPPGSPPGTHSTPTGVVFNPTAGFQIGGGNAVFLFSTEDGTIDGWNPSTGTTTVRLTLPSTAVYKGLTLDTLGGDPYLLAANFSEGRIDVLKGTLGSPDLPGKFTDPGLPAGFAPFNIQELGGQIYVTYAQQNPADPGEELAGPGLGILSQFDPAGNFIRRVATGGSLNAPWGLALAPGNFGDFSNALLVGNFGDGRINALDPASGALLGQLADAGGAPIAIDGLWALRFGNDAMAGRSNELFFTAGIGGEAHGLFGELAAVPEPGTLALFSLGLLLLVAGGIRNRLRGPGSAGEETAARAPHC